MADPVESMTNQLLQAGFVGSAPAVDAFSDPGEDTSLVLTLDQLHPYDLNPRVTRNPMYDDIKSSIRGRGLDAPPAVTRRPGEKTYIIRNGGNTRLSILRELWSETRQERYYRITCLFRPWSQRGEIVALTGHLAENELRGSLTFIERAVAVAKARELYVLEGEKMLSQAGLARLLSGDGYPISQSQISRMEDALHYLLPAIPTLLYGGLGWRQIVQLITLRRSAARVFDKHVAESHVTGDFLSMFHDVLNRFDGDPDTFVLEPVQDELVAVLSEVLGVDYDLLNLDINDMGTRHHLLGQTLASGVPMPDPQPANAVAASPSPPQASKDASANVTEPHPARAAEHAPPKPTAAAVATTLSTDATPPPTPPSSNASTASTPRLQQLRHMLADHHAQPPAESPCSIPIHAEGTDRATDLWRIEPHLDEPSRLRVHIAQLATELMAQLAPHVAIESASDGIGYRGVVASHDLAPATRDHALWTLLDALRDVFAQNKTDSPTEHSLAATTEVASLLVGAPLARLADEALIKVFRLIRLARRLSDLDSNERADPLDEDA